VAKIWKGDPILEGYCTALQRCFIEGCLLTERWKDGDPLTVATRGTGKLRKEEGHRSFAVPGTKI